MLNPAGYKPPLSLVRSPSFCLSSLPLSFSLSLSLLMYSLSYPTPLETRLKFAVDLCLIVDCNTTQEIK